MSRRGPLALVSTAEMRELEQGSVNCGVSLEQLMDNAGLAIARAVHQLNSGPGKVLVLVGPGNNGGDGLVCAEHLRSWGWTVFIHLAPARERDRERFPVLERVDPGPIPAERVDVVVDALLGTGNTRPLEGAIASALDETRARHAAALVVAVDLPSGVNGDSGAADPRTLPARLTVTLGLAKTGLYLYPAHELAGEIRVADIGIPRSLTQGVHTWLGDASVARAGLPARPADSHKGTYGKLLVVAGSASYCGAPYLAGLAAARVGAGLLRLALPESAHRVVASKFTEGTFTALPETSAGWLAAAALPRLRELLDGGFDCLLAGPGLGQDPETSQVLDHILLGGLDLPGRVVLDADALNNLARHPDWHARLPRGCVLTPHPAELGRLAALPIEQVIANRFELAREKAREWGQVIVAKGANTIIAAPDGRAVIDPGANPLLATAGTGDVLAGTIAGLLTQGIDAWAGAVAGTYVASTAARRLIPQYGRSGMIASDLHAQLPLALKSISS